jgi:hypothetical protein
MHDIYAHEIELQNINEIDRIFNVWLKDQVSGTGYDAKVQSRKLTIAPSNSCFLNQLTSLAYIDLACTEIKSSKTKKKQNKIEVPKRTCRSGSATCQSMLSCLVFTVVYKVKYTQKGCTEQSRDFVFGRKAFFPNFDLRRGLEFINDRQISFYL